MYYIASSPSPPILPWRAPGKISGRQDTLQLGKGSTLGRHVTCKSPKYFFWFSEIFPIVIPIVIQKHGAMPQNSSYKYFFLVILLCVIAVHHCAED